MSVHEKMTELADAIRNKTGGTELLTIDGMIEGVNTIGCVDIDKEFAYALIGNAETVYVQQYEYNDIIEAVNLPNATSIDHHAFYCCNSLTTVDLPNVTTIEHLAFSECAMLKNVNLPKLTTIEHSVFKDCMSLENIHLPNIITIAYNAFENCDSLTNVDAPNMINIGRYAFFHCDALTTVDLPNVLVIEEHAFDNCHMLKALILRSETICNMQINAIKDTSIVSNEFTVKSNGFIYVPTGLYESYISDFIPKIIAFEKKNGKTMNNSDALNFARAILRKLEEYTVDGTIYGALDESKI